MPRTPKSKKKYTTYMKWYMTAKLRQDRINRLLAKIKTFDIYKRIKTPINKRGFDIMDLMLRTHSAYVQIKQEVSYDEMMILLYLHAFESPSTRRIAFDMQMSINTAHVHVQKLTSLDLVKAVRTGQTNYTYLTEEGKKAVKTFMDLVANTETNLLKKKPANDKDRAIWRKASHAVRNSDS